MPRRVTAGNITALQRVRTKEPPRSAHFFGSLLSQLSSFPPTDLPPNSLERLRERRILQLRVRDRLRWVGQRLAREGGPQLELEPRRCCDWHPVID